MTVPAPLPDTQEPLDLDAVLVHTLSALKPGPASQMLLVHLARQVARDPGPAPSPKALARWHTTVDAATRAHQASRAGGPSQGQALGRLSQALLARYPPWNGPRPWGALALAHAIQAGHFRRVEDLLGLPGAPAGAALTALALPRCSDPTGAGPHPKPNPHDPARTALGWALSAKVPLDHARLVVHALLARGVDPNAPVAPGGQPPLLLAAQPDLLRELMAAGARMGGKHSWAQWLEPSVPVDLVRQQLATWCACLAQGDLALAQDLRGALSELVERMGAYLGALPSPTPRVPLELARQFRALARRLGTDPIQPGPTDPDLPAAWERGVLVALHGCRADASRLYGPADALPGAMWTPAQPPGLAPARIPHSFWAFMRAVLDSTSPRPHPPAPENWDLLPAVLADLAQASGKPNKILDWRLVGGAFGPACDARRLDAWRNVAAGELACAVGILSRIDQQSIDGRSRSGARDASAHEPWLGRNDREADRAFDRLVGLSTTDFLAHPGLWPSGAAQHLLAAHALMGLPDLPSARAILETHRPSLDLAALARQAKSPWAVLMGGKRRAHERAGFILEMGLPTSAPLAPPRVRL